MHWTWSTLALQTVNLVILIWLLQRFLYKPVLRLVDARRAEIDRAFAEARAAAAEAAKRLAAIETERAGIGAERTASLQEAAVQIAEAAEAKRRQAERDCADLLDSTRKMLAAERDRAKAELRGAALDLGRDFALRLLSELPPALRAEAWLDRVAKQIEDLPAEERRQLKESDILDIVTALPLSAEAAAQWRLRLGALLGPATIRFSADESLFAGAELHFPTAILRVSWQSLLNSMRLETPGP